MTITLDTSEVHAWAADLRRAGDEAGPMAELIVAKTGHDVAADADALVPVDTGYLKGSISVDIDGTSFVVGPTADYGEYVELGTSRMNPEPFMAPAFDRNLIGFQSAVEELGVRALR